MGQFDLIHRRDQYVKIHEGNVKPNALSNFNKENNVLLHGNYDLGSVMHYGRCDFTQNGKETITPLVSNMF